MSDNNNDNLDLKIDFPIFAVEGNEVLDDEVEDAIELQFAMLDLVESLKETNKYILQVGQNLNLYINNILTLDEPFDFEKQLINFTPENEICFYTQEEIKNLVESEEYCNMEPEEILVKLPPKENKYKLNDKQIKRCMNIIEQYNKLTIDYDYYQYELELYNEEYDDILEDVKEQLQETKLFEVTKGNFDEMEIEPFNRRKHELLITQDTDTMKWRFVYVRKKDKKKLISIINKNTKELEKKEKDIQKNKENQE